MLIHNGHQKTAQHPSWYCTGVLKRINLGVANVAFLHMQDTKCAETAEPCMTEASIHTNADFLATECCWRCNLWTLEAPSFHTLKRIPTIPIRRAYNEAARENSDDDGDYMPNFQSIRTQAKRVRATFMPLPDIPREIDEVNITGTWSKTWKGHQFLTYLDNYWGLAVFASGRMIW